MNLVRPADLAEARFIHIPQRLQNSQIMEIAHQVPSPGTTPHHGNARYIITHSLPSQALSSPARRTPRWRVRRLLADPPSIQDRWGVPGLPCWQLQTEEADLVCNLDWRKQAAGAKEEDSKPLRARHGLAETPASDPAPHIVLQTD